MFWTFVLVVLFVFHLKTVKILIVKHEHNSLMLFVLFGYGELDFAISQMFN